MQVGKVLDWLSLPKNSQSYRALLGVLLKVAIGCFPLRLGKMPKGHFCNYLTQKNVCFTCKIFKNLKVFLYKIGLGNKNEQYIIFFEN